MLFPNVPDDAENDKNTHIYTINNLKIKSTLQIRPKKE